MQACGHGFQVKGSEADGWVQVRRGLRHKPLSGGNGGLRLTPSGHNPFSLLLRVPSRMPFVVVYVYAGLRSLDACPGMG